MIAAYTAKPTFVARLYVCSQALKPTPVARLYVCSCTAHYRGQTLRLIVSPSLVHRSCSSNTPTTQPPDAPLAVALLLYYYIIIFIIIFILYINLNLIY